MTIHEIEVGLFLGGYDFNQYKLRILVPNNFDKWSETKKEQYLEKNQDKYLEQAVNETVPFIQDWNIWD